MLKKMIINKRSIPVPVPIVNMEEAMVWIEQTFLKNDQTITKITLNDVDVVEAGSQAIGLNKIKLGLESKLEIQIDSPLELAVQTLETLRNMATMIEQILKPMAVECWQTTPINTPNGIDEINDDLEMVCDLFTHLFELIDAEEISVGQMKDHHRAVATIVMALDAARSHSDWKGFAKILLNQLEPRFNDLIQETGNVQAMLFAHRTESMLRSREAG